MQFGIHLPQYGRSAGAEGIGRAARQAEDLGFADVWVSDHLAVPTGVPYPAPFLFEPLVTLTWAATHTSTIRLGTGVLVLPYRQPLHLAKELASLDVLADGRVLLGIGAGWLEAEFDALGVPFDERGPRTDDALSALRACWEQRPVDYEGRFYQLRDLQFLPQPGRIPVWSGGTSERALRRATTVCDGWQGAYQDPAAIEPIVARLRRERPESTFTISVRVDWDGIAGDLDQYARQLDQYVAAGVQHLYACPVQKTVDEWLRSVEALHGTFEPYKSTEP
jgi:probable F420-dependent oxidoreductase